MKDSVTELIVVRNVQVSVWWCSEYASAASGGVSARGGPRTARRA